MKTPNPGPGTPLFVDGDRIMFRRHRNADEEIEGEIAGDVWYEKGAPCANVRYWFSREMLEHNSRGMLPVANGVPLDRIRLVSIVDKLAELADG